jgi:hypothetical protein
MGFEGLLGERWEFFAGKALDPNVGVEKVGHWEASH